MSRVTKRNVWTHGIEIEQFPADTNVGTESYANPRDTMRGGMPSAVVRNAQKLDWHRDGSQPQETDIGPFISAKTALDVFFAETRDQGLTWDWHASNGEGRGAGSHVHFSLDEDKLDDPVAAWTIAWNTVVELAPFMSPFWCHNWEDGYRDGSGAITQWARPQTTRASQTSVEHMVRYGGSAPGASSYSSVRANARRGNKPFTIEIRLNDAHPTMALAGVQLLRVVCGHAIERGDSPKLANRDALSRTYTAVEQRAEQVGLIAAMKEETDAPIVFEEGRGVPGVDALEFASPWELFEAINRAHRRPSNGGWLYRTQNLALAGDDRCSPKRNIDALWNIDAPEDEFSWDFGPEELADEMLANFELSRQEDTSVEEAARAYVLDSGSVAPDYDHLGELFG